MKKADFQKLLDEEFEQLRKLVATKGEEYTRSDDQLDNFKRRAEEGSLHPEQVWLVFAGKHYDAICSWIRREGQVLSDESIESRIRDLQVFLYLLQALVRERSPAPLGLDPEEEITGAGRSSTWGAVKAARSR
jgi:hypothetical protein